MGKRTVGLLGPVVAACLALAACGGDDGDRLTTAELAAQGNAVCAQLDKDVKAVADTFPASLDFTPQQMQELYTKILPLVDKAKSGFSKLTPPKDSEKALESALDQLEIDRRTLEGATASPEAAKRLFDTGVDPFTATNQKLAAAGITGCGGSAADGGTASTTAPTTAATSTPPSS